MAAIAEIIEMRVMHSTMPVRTTRSAPLDEPPEVEDDDPEPDEPEPDDEEPVAPEAEPVAVPEAPVIPSEARSIPLEMVEVVTQLDDEGIDWTVEGVTRSPTV